MLCIFVAKYLSLSISYSGENTYGAAPVVCKPEPEPTEKAPVVCKPEPTEKAPVVRKPEPTKKPPVVCKHHNHQYPVTSNGKLLDVAVIRESTQKPKQSTQKKSHSTQKRPRSGDQVVEYVAKKGKDQGLLECLKCGDKHKIDPRWVCCPQNMS